MSAPRWSCRTDAAKWEIEARSLDEAVAAAVAAGEWAPLDSARERRDIAAGAWLAIDATIDANVEVKARRIPTWDDAVTAPAVTATATELRRIARLYGEPEPWYAKAYPETAAQAVRRRGIATTATILADALDELGKPAKLPHHLAARLSDLFKEVRP